jgi:hypothetical protein
VSVDEAVLDYAAAADDLTIMSEKARQDGWGEWATELMGLASIATRAADAEVADPAPPSAPCGLCHGLVVCDIAWHQARRVIS